MDLKYLATLKIPIALHIFLYFMFYILVFLFLKWAKTGGGTY